ncbi:hypothetical protein PC128_g14522 [Phytophthora cactorum]|nr:hypothetical protein PC128_g14522 [Phytophthora cactorum]
MDGRMAADASITATDRMVPPGNPCRHVSRGSTAQSNLTVTLGKTSG